MKYGYTSKEYFRKVSIKYNNFFTYLYDYNGIKATIKVTCPKHGLFITSADSHLNGKKGGCKKCQIENRIKKYKEKHSKLFVEKSHKIHNNKYDYSKVNYIKNTTKVDILCKIHGIFTQSPASHLRGRGCRECAKLTMGGYGGFNFVTAERNKKEWINKKYYIYIVEVFDKSELFIKFGITIRKRILDRFKGVPYKRKLLFKIETNLYDAIYIEDKIKIKFNKHKYEPNKYFKGHTECFKLKVWKNIENTLLEEV